MTSEAAFLIGQLDLSYMSAERQAEVKELARQWSLPIPPRLATPPAARDHSLMIRVAFASTEQALAEQERVATSPGVWGVFQAQPGFDRAIGYTVGVSAKDVEVTTYLSPPAEQQ